MSIAGRGLRNRTSLCQSLQCMRQLDPMLKASHRPPALFFLPQHDQLLRHLLAWHEGRAVWHGEAAKVLHRQFALAQDRYGEQYVLYDEKVL